MDLQSIALATWPCRLSAGNIRGRRGRRRGGITRSWGCLRLRSGGWVIRTGPVAGPVTILAASCNRASGAHRPGSGGAPRDACAGPRRAGGGRSWRASSRPAARELVRCPVRGSWNASRARTNCAGSPWSPSTPLSSSVDAEASPSAVLDPWEPVGNSPICHGLPVVPGVLGQRSLRKLRARRCGGAASLGGSSQTSSIDIL